MKTFRLNIDYDILDKGSSNTYRYVREYFNFRKMEDFPYEHQRFIESINEVLLDVNDYTKNYDYESIVKYAVYLFTHLCLGLYGPKFFDKDSTEIFDQIRDIRQKIKNLDTSSSVIISFHIQELEDLIIGQMEDPVGFKLRYV